MKFLIVCLAIASCASAALLPYQQQVYQQRQVLPVHPAPIHSVHQVAHHVGADAAAPILKSVSDIHPDGQYVVEYETGNGIVAKESGLAGKSVQGSYAYTSPEGTPISLTYVADENGYQPTGAHLPVAPETPVHVLRALEWIAAHPQQEDKFAGRYVQPVQPIIPVVKPATYTPFRFNKQF